MATQLEFNYYRTIDKSEIDLIIQGDFGTIPIEIKLNSSIKKIALRSLSNFLNDLNLPLGIVINRSKKIEQLTDKIFQIPVNYL
jgi:predicted AAA+ superfamily ATPase